MSRKPWNPRKWLEVHGKKVKVRFVDGNNDKDLEFGRLDARTLKPTSRQPYYLVKIDRNEPERTQRHSLLHDLMHVTDDLAGELLSEEVVTVESQILFDLFDKNPGVATWIGGKEK